MLSKAVHCGTALSLLVPVRLRQTADPLENLKNQKMKQTSIHISVPELRFCKYNRLPKIQSCRNAESPQPINYVKSSLCMFNPCYVRKKYALFHKRHWKLIIKQGRERMIARIYQNLSYFKAETNTPPVKRYLIRWYTPPGALMMTQPMFLA